MPDSNNNEFIFFSNLEDDTPTLDVMLATDYNLLAHQSLYLSDYLIIAFETGKDVSAR